MAQIAVNHEQYRKDVWEPLKNFRGRYESAKILSDNILEAKEITLKKKELDKLTLNLIKTCILEGHDDKVYSYIDNLCFKQSYKLSIKLCSSLKNNSLANKVAAYIQDKEQRSLIESHQTLAKEVTGVQNQNVDPTPRSSYQAQFTDPQVALKPVVQQEKQSQDAEKEDKVVETPVTEEKQHPLSNIQEPASQLKQPSQAVTKKGGNPFARSTNLNQKQTMGMSSTGGAKKDIFSDLKGVKRANPFVNKAGANGSMKQKKIC